MDDVDSFPVWSAYLLERGRRSPVGRHIEVLRDDPAGGVGRRHLEGDLSWLRYREDQITTDHSL
jgi:hypothetical protein